MTFSVLHSAHWLRNLRLRFSRSEYAWNNRNPQRCYAGIQNNCSHTEDTTKKIYSITYVCCLCGFSFAVKDGNIQIKKSVKLRLTKEKQAAIREVTRISNPMLKVYAQDDMRRSKRLWGIRRSEINWKISNSTEKEHGKTLGSSSRKNRFLASPKPDEKVSQFISILIKYFRLESFIYSLYSANAV